MKFSNLQGYDTQLYEQLKTMVTVKHQNSYWDDLELYFVATRNGVEVPLCENGENIRVCEKNKMKYANLLAQFRIFPESHKVLLEELVKGFQRVVPVHSLSTLLFPKDLQVMISGEIVFNVQELKQNLRVFGIDKDSPIVEWLLQFISELDSTQIKHLIMFWSGSPCLPVTKFATADPWTLNVHSFLPSENFPTAATCSYTLTMPNYDSYEKLKLKLHYAINEATVGFTER